MLLAVDSGHHPGGHRQAYAESGQSQSRCTCHYVSGQPGKTALLQVTGTYKITGKIL